jgi:transcriptional regulator with XRE-family HTH domain
LGHFCSLAALSMPGIALRVNLALSCSAVEPAPRTPARADAITRLIGERLPALRKSAGMNQADLGRAMAKLRPQWSRSTVAKLERHLRGSLSVADLLALAMALDTPVVWLLADPAVGDSVPIAQDLDVDPWTALLWMIGKQPLSNRPGRAWDGPALVLERLLAVVAGVDEYRRHRRGLDELRSRAQTDPDADDLARRLQEIDQNPEVEKYLLESIAKQLRELDDWDLPMPPLPLDVRDRAAEFGVELPGHEG